MTIERPVRASAVKEIVWLKKDLRLVDHEPFAMAADSGHEVVPLFIYEPEVMAAADFSNRHFLFQNECLKELDDSLAELGGGLVLRSGEAHEVFSLRL